MAQLMDEYVADHGRRQEQQLQVQAHVAGGGIAAPAAALVTDAEPAVRQPSFAAQRRQLRPEFRPGALREPAFKLPQSRLTRLCWNEQPACWRCRHRPLSVPVAQLPVFGDPAQFQFSRTAHPGRSRQVLPQPRFVVTDETAQQRSPGPDRCAQLHGAIGPDAEPHRAVAGVTDHLHLHAATVSECRFQLSAHRAIRRSVYPGRAQSPTVNVLLELAAPNGTGTITGCTPPVGTQLVTVTSSLTSATGGSTFRNG